VFTDLEFMTLKQFHDTILDRIYEKLTFLGISGAVITCGVCQKDKTLDEYSKTKRCVTCDYTPVCDRCADAKEPWVCSDCWGEGPDL